MLATVVPLWRGLDRSCTERWRWRLIRTLPWGRRHGSGPVFVIVVIKSQSTVQLFVTPWTIAHQALLSSTISQSLLKFTSTELVMLSNRFILCCSRLLLPPLFPSVRIFSNELVLHNTLVAKVLELQLQH